jgi:hypothetical protein
MSTTFPTHPRTTTALGSLILLLGAAALGLGADAPTQVVDAGGLKFQAPAAWKQAAATGMRKAQLKIEPVKGDEEGADLIVFAFPGGAGSVDANVQRWQSTFKDKDGKPPKVDVKTVKGQNVEATRVEIAGHYYPSAFPGQPKQPDRDNYRLLGAIVLTDTNSYFLRLVGPDKTVTAVRPDFDKLISSFKVSDK